MPKVDEKFLHMMSRSMPTMPKTYNAEQHSVQAVVATENPVEVVNWDEWRMEKEILLIDGFQLPEGADQVPLLDSHNRWTVGSVLGSIRDFVPAGSELRASLFFTTAGEGASAETKVREGHLKDISAGYKTLESYWIPEGQKQVIRNKEYTGPVRVTTQWLLKEGSLTPIGADPRSKARSPSGIPPEIKQKLIERGMSPEATDEEAEEFLRTELSKPKTTQRKDPQMTPEEQLEAQKKANEEKQRKEEEAARARAEEEARVRVEAIYDIATRNQGKVTNMSELRDKAVKERWSVDKFKGEILENMANTPATPAPAEEGNRIALVTVVKPWRKRSVATLNWMAARAMGSEKAEQFGRQLSEMNAKVTEQQRQDEEREAFEIIDKAPIAPMQKIRLMSSLSDGAGGYTLPKPFLAEVFVIVEERGVARREFRPIPMGGKTLDMSTIATKAIAYWVTQGSNITAADLAFGTGQLLAAKLAAITSWSSELEEDTAIAFLAVVAESMAEAIYTAEDDAGFIGDGTATYGSFTGLVKAATAGYTMAAGKTAFADADADDFKAVRDSVSLARRRGAKWFLHPDIISNVEGLKDLQGRYIYRGPGENRPATLWGYPIANNGEGVESMPAASASAISTKFVAFGNPRNMLMGMRRELEFSISKEAILNSAADAITYNAFQGDGTILKATERIAFKLVLANSIAFLKTAAA